jgi:hypothetical protein
MDLSVYLPAVMTCIVALPLDGVLELVTPYTTIKDLLNLKLLVTIDDSGRWWRVTSTNWNGVREH